MLAGQISSFVTGATGLLGLLLASIGIYGVVSHQVNQRIPEIGIRIALGAERRNIIWLIVRGAVRLMTWSGALGLLLGLGLSRILAASIFKVNAADPSIFLVPAVILAIMGLLASYLPARRATRVEPTAALRYE